MRAVLYARYSSDLQSPTSIVDQHRALRDALPRLGLREAGVFSDAAITGSSLARPGLEAALAEIEAGRADVLVAEALDRISRDLEHVARIAKRIAFRGARIVTLSEGEIGALHIGLSGTMAQLYLEQLAEKTRRGLRGVVAEGRIAAGRAYGYRPTAERGRFEIVAEEAEIVRRIMHEYAAGISPRTIAKTLNAEGIPGPRGGTWKGNAILGDRNLGVGIVNNRLYIGDVVWNRSTWRKNPRTGRRQPFPLPESQWVVTRADHLRIVDEALWQAVRQRQGELVKRHGLIRRWTVTDAARHDGRELAGLLDGTNTASQVWADTAYRSRKNEQRIASAGLVSKVHFRRAPGKALTPQHQQANAARSKVRSAVEHPFAEQKSRMGLFVRTIGIARATAKIGIANIAFNMKRLVFLERSAIAA